jgi:hypothetical protein
MADWQYHRRDADAAIFVNWGAGEDYGSPSFLPFVSRSLFYLQREEGNITPIPNTKR